MTEKDWTVKAGWDECENCGKRYSRAKPKCPGCEFPNDEYIPLHDRIFKIKVNETNTT